MTDKKQTKKKTRKKKKKGIEEIKKINLLGRTFKIIWESPRNFEKDGEIDLSTREIRVEPSLPEDEKEKVLIHECYHAGLDFFDYDSEFLVAGLTSFHIDLNQKLNIKNRKSK